MDRDVALNILKLKDDASSRSPDRVRGSIYTMREPAYDDRRRPNLLTRWVDTFRRDPTKHITPDAVSGAMGLPMREHRGRNYFDLQSANFATANSGLSRELKGRHLQMIAIGGSIGR